MSADPKDSTVIKTKSPRKVRDVEAINADVISYARKFFAQRNFDQVRLEDIAEKAGTSVSDIMRNFESKEGLFQRCIDQQFKLWDMMSADRNKLGEHLSKYVTAQIKSEDQLSHLLLFIKGSLHKGSKKSIREKMDDQFLKPYAKLLGGEKSVVRANLITSMLFGISFFHYISEVGVFQNENEVKELRELLAPLIQKLIDGNS